MKQIILPILFLIYIALFGYALLSPTFARQEIANCYNLLAQSTDYRNAGFYLTKEEKDMCDSRGIKIDAQVYDKDKCVNGVSDDVPRCLIPEEYFTN